jgi:hypothetical protein
MPFIRDTVRTIVGRFPGGSRFLARPGPPAAPPLPITAELFERLQATFRRKHEGSEFDAGDDAVLLFMDLFLISWLRRDGFVEWYDWSEDPNVVHFASEDELVMALVIGSETLEAPELLDFLPPRPVDARDCPECNGAGRVTYPVTNSRGEPWTPICGSCWGRGWKAVE